MPLDLLFEFDGRHLIVRVERMGGRLSAVIYEGDRPVSTIGYALPEDEDLGSDVAPAIAALMRLMHDDVLNGEIVLQPRLQ